VFSQIKRNSFVALLDILNQGSQTHIDLSATFQMTNDPRVQFKLNKINKKSAN
jgi:hypothetical protein